MALQEMAPAEGEDSAEAEAHRGSCQEELKVRLIAISTAAGKPVAQKTGPKRRGSKDADIKRVLTNPAPAA